MCIYIYNHYNFGNVHVVCPKRDVIRGEGGSQHQNDVIFSKNSLDKPPKVACTACAIASA